MSENLTMRLLWAVLVGGAFGWVAAYGNAQMKKPGTKLGSRPRYGSMAYGIILPLAVLVYAVIEFIVFRGNLDLAVQATVSFCFGIFLHISLYFLLLMLALPFLRKRISALACALLWMIPNYLYFISNMELSSPLFVFRVPGRLIWVLAVVWLAGFAGVFLFKVVSHLRFRAWLLKGVRDPLPRTMDVWYEELNRANIVNPKFCLGIAPNVKTPLTVGLIPCATWVLLPDRPYSEEELRLILRHEIVHICRGDVWSKFFLVFCAAMCWFNPLMWIAARKSADDLELSCDETVLAGEDSGSRKRYAELILKTAGDERGFTTCLSATATALRYRLKNIVNPAKKRSGAVTVAAMFVLLFMSCGYAAFAYDAGTGASLIYREEDPSRFSISSVHMQTGSEEYEKKRFRDEAALEAFHQYMASAELEHLTGNYNFDDSSRKMTVIYETPWDHKLQAVTVYDHAVKIVPYWAYHETFYYYLPEGTDWAYLDTLLAKQ